VSEYLVVRLAREADQASWLVLSEQGHRLSHTSSGPLSAAAAASHDRKVMLLVPGIEAVSKRISLPVKRASRIQQMLPFTLEDAVAEDVEELHFAAGPRAPDGSIAVAIVSRHAVADWLARSEEAGLRVDSAFVDLQGVPETPGSLTLMLEGSRIYGRLPEREPFVFEDLTLAALVEILAAETDASAAARNLVVYADDDGLSARAVELQALRDQVATLETTVLPDGVLPRFAATLVTSPGSNLLQGTFRVASDWSALWRPWRLPAVLVAALAVVAVLVQAASYLRLASADDDLTAVLVSSCQAAFATASLSACDSEIRNRLAVAGADVGVDSADGFLDTIASVAQARDESMLIQALSFRDGVTNLRITAPDVQTLDNLAQNLGSDGRFQASIQSTVPGDEGIEARLQIAGTRR